jgi:hypothetical protein
MNDRRNPEHKTLDLSATVEMFNDYLSTFTGIKRRSLPVGIWYIGVFGV